MSYPREPAIAAILGALLKNAGTFKEIVGTLIENTGALLENIAMFQEIVGTFKENMRTLIETVVMFKETVGTFVEFDTHFIDHQVNLTFLVSSCYQFCDAYQSSMPICCTKMVMGRSPIGLRVELIWQSPMDAKLDSGANCLNHKNGV